jgi:cystathionine beta-synthase
MAAKNVFDNILSCIGNTPMVRLHKIVDGARTPIYAKLEFMNPGSSVKDRIGLAIVEDAERQGLVRPGGTIVEATSGNTGVGLALAAAIRGYRCVFTIPDKMSTEKVRLLKAFGAQVIVTPTVDPSHAEYYVTVAKNIVKATPNSFLANQFYNQVNPEAHYKTTGPELWEQTEGKIDVLVGGLGTGGTMSGAGKYLKEKNAKVRIIGADPVGSVFKAFKETGRLVQSSVYKVEGIGQDKIPTTTWMDYIDEFREVSDKDSFNVARRLAREEALFAGGSSGTATKVAIDIARELDDPAKMVVVVLTDTGERYLSKFHNDEWMREHRFLDEVAADVRQLLMQKPSPKPLVAGTPKMTVKQALDLMARENVSQVPIIDHGESVGSCSEAHLMSRVLDKKAALDGPISDSMEAPFPVIGGNESLEYVSRLLARDNSALLVRTGKDITGILTRYDVIHTMSR